MEKPKTQEEIAKIEKSRAASDAELWAGGAEYVVEENGGKILRITEEQKDLLTKAEEIKKAEEMRTDKEKATTEERTPASFKERRRMTCEEGLSKHEQKTGRKVGLIVRSLFLEGGFVDTLFIDGEPQVLAPRFLGRDKYILTKKDMVEAIAEFPNIKSFDTCSWSSCFTEEIAAALVKYAPDTRICCEAVSKPEQERISEICKKFNLKYST